MAVKAAAPVATQAEPVAPTVTPPGEIGVPCSVLGIVIHEVPLPKDVPLPAKALNALRGLLHPTALVALVKEQGKPLDFPLEAAHFLPLVEED